MIDSTRQSSTRVVLWMVAFALLVGFVGGRAMSGGGNVEAAATDADATATRSAELEELARLRTQVAATAVCPMPAVTETPLPTATPTPPPPVAMGQPIAYGDNWTVVVNTFTTPAPNPRYTPVGKVVQIGVTVTNNAAENRALPFDTWVLVDQQGRTFAMSREATSQLYGPDWYLGSDPSLPVDFTIVFDVAVDAGNAFILGSTADPAFRIAIQIQLLG